MVRVGLAVLVVLGLAGCTIPIAGEDSFRKAATRRTGVVDKPLEQVYDCFLRKGLNTGYQQLSPESGTAVWSATPGVTYSAMADFKRISPEKTEVTVLGLPGGDWTRDPKNIWDDRVIPCM